MGFTSGGSSSRASPLVTRSRKFLLRDSILASFLSLRYAQILSYLFILHVYRMTAYG